MCILMSLVSVYFLITVALCWLPELHNKVHSKIQYLWQSNQMKHKQTRNLSTHPRDLQPELVAQIAIHKYSIIRTTPCRLGVGVALHDAYACSNQNARPQAALVSRAPRSSVPLTWIDGLGLRRDLHVNYVWWLVRC